MNYPPWPKCDSAFEDTSGIIAPEVYQIAGAYWQQAARVAENELRDAMRGHTLLLEAAAAVSRVLREGRAVKNVGAYLYTSYLRLVAKESQCEQHHADLLNARPLAPVAETEAAMMERLHRETRVRWALAQMPRDIRDIAELLLLGWTFEEIGRDCGQNPAVLRNKYNRCLARIVAAYRKQFDSDIE